MGGMGEMYESTEQVQPQNPASDILLPGRCCVVYEVKCPMVKKISHEQTMKALPFDIHREAL